MKKKVRIVLLVVMLLCVVMLSTGCTVLQGTLDDAASDDLSVDNPLTDEPLGGLLGNRTDTVEIILLLTVLSVLPSILIMMTGFTRIVIVLSMVRNAIGLQSMPPNQVIIGLALFITFFVMQPVITEIKDTAYTPYIENRITQTEATERAMKPLRTFMIKQTYKKDIDMFISMANKGKPDDQLITDYETAPNSVVMAAFITSEVQRAFEIGFFIYLPFIVVDMIVASVLMSMGMMMLPPVSIALPFKVLLFVMVDGWALTVQTLISGFG